MKLLIVFAGIVAVCSGLSAPDVTGTTPPAVPCPNTLCKGKADGNFAYVNPTNYKLVKNYFVQCLGGNAYCQACWPLSLEFSPRCNQCLYGSNDECVTTLPFQPATTFQCPDKCPHRGPKFTGNIADPAEKRQYVACWEGVTVGCVACPGKLEFNESENACLFEGKYITEPTKN
ncbi:uncharacterized protein [Clytia hemisphaerica]|uniref:Uncharacterized protein n=1 Tax=Clytia hemisphaerica TaxID=252671 RepID=A0A7M5WJE0_9CNID